MDGGKSDAILANGDSHDGACMVRGGVDWTIAADPTASSPNPRTCLYGMPSGNAVVKESQTGWHGPIQNGSPVVVVAKAHSDHPDSGRDIEEGS